MGFTLFVSHYVFTCMPQWLRWRSLMRFTHTAGFLCIWIWYEMHITGTTEYINHLWLGVNAAVWANLTKGATATRKPFPWKHAALLKWPLIGYFQLLHMTLLYSLPCAKMFQSKHELSLLFRAPPDRWLMFTRRGEVSSGRSETNGVKIGESESPRYCSQRPLVMSGSFPESAQHTCSDTCTQILAHCAAAAVNKHTVTFTMAVCLASHNWIFLFFLLHNKVYKKWLRITNSSKMVSFKQL